MSRGRGKRPARGPAGPNVLVVGDEGEYQPQGGAGPQAAGHGGDLASHEFGVPEADIPGGLKHLVNPETHADQPIRKPPRSAEYHNEHGVPPHYGPYAVPPGELDEHPAPRPVPEPERIDAVPVYQVEGPGRVRTYRGMAAWNLNVHNSTQEPSRVCGFDPNRVEILLLNEDSNTDIRIAEKFDALQAVGAQGTGPAGEGALIWHGTNSYLKLKTQSEIFAITTSSTSAARLSVIVVTETPEEA